MRTLLILLIVIFVCPALSLRAEDLFFDDFSTYADGDGGEVLQRWETFKGWTKATVRKSGDQSELELKREIRIRRAFVLDAKLTIEADLVFPSTGRTIGGIKVTPAGEDKERHYLALFDVREDQLYFSLVRVDSETREVLVQSSTLRPAVDYQKLLLSLHPTPEGLTFSVAVNGAELPSAVDANPFPAEDVRIAVFTFDDTVMQVRKIGVKSIDP